MIEELESVEFSILEPEPEETVSVVVDQNELFQRLTEWAAESMPREDSVDASTVAEAVVSALDQREEEAQLMTGEEILIPGSEDILVIKEVVQSILSFFQEDDHDVLMDIRDDITDIREYLEQSDSDLHPMMTTSFEDYTVTEGLLLLILLGLFIRFCFRMLKGGFSWLGWW